MIFVNKNIDFDFASDIKILAKSINNQKLIKICSHYNKELFQNWFKNPKNSERIQQILTDKTTQHAINELFVIDESYAGGFSQKDFSPLLIDAVSPFKKFIQHYSAFNSFKNEFEFLSPYSNILSVCYYFNAEPKLSINIIHNDLKRINDLYNADMEGKNQVQPLKGKKQTVAAMKQEMYVYLFQQFSNELSNEASNSNPALSKAIRNGALSSPGELSSLFKLVSFPIRDMKEIDTLVKYALKNYGKENHTSVYEHVKSKLLMITNKITVIDPKHPLHALYNPSWIPGGNQDAEKESVINDSSLFLTNDVLTLISVFLFKLKEAIIKEQNK